MSPLLALGAAAAAVVTLALATARTPADPVPDLDGYLTRWRSLHGDHDPRESVFLRGWLRLAYRIADPLARRGVHPDVLTLGSLWPTFAVLVLADAGGRWTLLAGLMLVASGLTDTLDGAVAALTSRATSWGYVLDSVVDRVNDALYLVALWLAGAPAWLAVATAAVCWLLEYVRARGANVGTGQIGILTVGERANRVIFCAAALVSAGLLPAQAGLLVTGWLAALGLLSVVGLVQLLVAVRHQLAGG